MSAAPLASAKIFEEFFKINFSRLCYHAALTTDNKDVAEDITQEAFSSLWQKRNEFKDETAAKAWMYIVIRHKALNYLRHEKIKSKSDSILSKEVFFEENILRNVIKTEVLGKVYEAIELLPEGCKTVLKLAYFQGLKNKEIADVLSVSINTVKTQKARALQLLKLKIDPSLMYLFMLFLQLKQSNQS